MYQGRQSSYLLLILPVEGRFSAITSWGQWISLGVTVVFQLGAIITTACVLQDI